MSEQRILVTGAKGCIGAWTLRELVRGGHEPVAFDLPGPARRPRLIMTDDELAAVTFVEGDIRDPRGVDALFDEHGITHVIHLAALQLPFCRAQPALGAEVNVVGTVNLFMAAAARPEQVRRIAYASSIAAYDASDAIDGRPVASDAPTNPQSLYGVYKVAGEGIGRVFWLENEVASIGLRPNVLYGVGRDQGMTSTPTKAMLAAALREPYRISYGGETQFQYAPDVAQQFIRSVLCDFAGATVCNTGGTVRAMRDLVAAIDRSVPDHAGGITFDEAPLPFPSEYDGEALASLIGPLPETPLEDAVEETIRRFEALAAAGLVSTHDLQ